MTRPYKRARHQTYFSKGGFVKKDSFFSFFFNFLFPFSMGIFTNFFYHCNFSKEFGDSVGWSQAAGGSPANIGKMK